MIFDWYLVSINKYHFNKFKFDTAIIIRVIICENFNRDDTIGHGSIGIV